MHLLDNVIFFMFLSFLFGTFTDPILRRVTDYESLSNRYLFRTQKTYEKIGILWFRRFLEITPLGSFNTHIHFSKNRDLETFTAIRSHMGTAEMSHWVGFTAMLVFTGIAWWLRGPLVGLGYIIFNVIGNVYPALLQQYNKRRLCRLISAAERRVERAACPARSA